MRRVLPQLIVVAAGGLAFGMVYRCFLDDPSEASVAAALNKLRALRGPGESYSDVILRLVAIEPKRA